jgi:hypothetical protein
MDGYLLELSQAADVYVPGPGRRASWRRRPAAVNAAAEGMSLTRNAAANTWFAQEVHRIDGWTVGARGGAQCQYEHRRAPAPGLV